MLLQLKIDLTEQTMAVISEKEVMDPEFLVANVVITDVKKPWRILRSTIEEACYVNLASTYLYMNHISHI